MRRARPAVTDTAGSCRAVNLYSSTGHRNLEQLRKDAPTVVHPSDLMIAVDYTDLGAQTKLFAGRVCEITRDNRGEVYGRYVLAPPKAFITDFVCVQGVF
jgi:hypothetical protein